MHCQFELCVLSSSFLHAVQVTCDDHACMYKNFYYNNGKWYVVVDGNTPIPVWRFSRNQEVIPIHYQDAREFTKSVSVLSVKSSLPMKILKKTGHRARRCKVPNKP